MERDKKNTYVLQNKVSIAIIKKGSIFFSPFLLGFAGAWNKSWISINTTSEGRWLKYTEELYNSVEIDLKKVKNLTLVKDVKNLAAPLSHNLPILVLDCPDRSLYLQSSAEKVRKKYVLTYCNFTNFSKQHSARFHFRYYGWTFPPKKCQTVASVKYDMSISQFFI